VGAQSLWSRQLGGIAVIAAEGSWLINAPP
jgi:hypothetical protein